MILLWWEAFCLFFALWKVPKILAVTFAGDRMRRWEAWLFAGGLAGFYFFHTWRLL